MFDDTRGDRLAYDFETKRIKLSNGGRDPTEEERQAFRRKEDLAHRMIQAKLAEERRDAERARQQAERERRLLIDQRRQTRMTPPADATGISSAADIAQLVQSNSGYGQGANLVGLEKAPVDIGLDLEAVNFSRSRFRHVVFTADCKLADAIFVGADFEDVVFHAGCDLTGADFSQARLRGVVFQPGCRLDGASFQFARIEHGVVIEFDRNNLMGAVFLAGRSDKWHALCRSYSTFAQILNGALSMLYFSTIVLKLHAFKLLMVAQQMEHARQAAAAPSLASHRMMTPYEFLFGSQLSSLVLTALIALYQILRFIMTMKVSPLMEGERQSGYSPPQAAFMPLLATQKVVYVLGFVAMATFCYELYTLITQPAIWVPLKAAAAAP